MQPLFVPNIARACPKAKILKSVHIAVFFEKKTALFGDDYDYTASEDRSTKCSQKDCLKNKDIFNSHLYNGYETIM
jgi:hypothetical protein